MCPFRCWGCEEEERVGVRACFGASPCLSWSRFLSFWFRRSVSVFVSTSRLFFLSDFFVFLSIVNVCVCVCMCMCVCVCVCISLSLSLSLIGVNTFSCPTLFHSLTHSHLNIPFHPRSYKYVSGRPAVCSSRSVS